MFFLPHGWPRTHFSSLAHVPLSDCEARPPARLSGVVGDLGDSDHLVAFMSSRLLTSRMSGTRCRVSAILREPMVVQARFYRAMPWVSRRFHRVLTHSGALAERLPNALLVPHGGCWLRTVPAGPSPKSMRVAMIASDRRSAPGHRLRHRVAAWSKERCPDLALLGRGYRPLQHKEDGHLPYMFSVVIENSVQPGYFTEKIIDSMLCSSVPIYWGDPLIASHFDGAGIIRCDDEQSIREAILSASEGAYRSMSGAVESNRRRAMRYADFRTIVTEVVRSDLSFDPESR